MALLRLSIHHVHRLEVAVGQRLAAFGLSARNFGVQPKAKVSITIG